MSDPVVAFRCVTKRYARGSGHDSLRDLLGGFLGRRKSASSGTFLALDQVSFEVPAGEALGIVGPNGSGKSTALKLMTGIMLPTSGEIGVRGRIAPLIEVGAGFHPDLSGRENIHLNGAILGMTPSEVRAAVPEIVAFSGLGEFLDTPVKRYSSGMYMRLGFAIAAHIPSDILIVDEVLAVGDVGFRARCIERMMALKRSGRTILFVSHHSHQVRTLCDRVVYLKFGKKEFEGDPVEGTRRAQDDALLLAAVPVSGTGRAGDAAAAVATAVATGARLVSAVVVRGGDDAPLAPGDSLEVLVRYRIETPPSAPPQIAVSLVRSEDGVTACVLSTKERGASVPVTPGDHALRFRFESLPLYAGRHAVEVLLWDHAMVAVLDQTSAGSVEARLPDGHLINRPGAFVPQGTVTPETP